MKNFLLIIATSSISTFCFGQSEKSNTCTGNLNIDPIVQSQEITHYIFTGSDTTGLNVKVTKITVAESRKEMVKRRKSKDCDSPNPEDCMTQVLEEIPAVTMNLYTLNGPDVTSEYDTRKEKVSVTTREGGLINEGIVCAKNRSSKLIKKVQEALIKHGYPLTMNGIYDQATSLSVIDFQRSKSMPYGDLTLGVLAALGVK